jgi:hypothetical protein
MVEVACPPSTQLFSGGFSAQSFTLDAVGDSRTFDLGSVAFRELNGHSGVVASETNGLDIAARLTFTDPFSSLIEMLVSGSATTGSVSDSALDFAIDWNPVQVAFGSGGPDRSRTERLELHRSSDVDADGDGHVAETL